MCGSRFEAASHGDITGLFFCMCLRAKSGTFRFHIPACMKGAYGDTCLALVWRQEQPYFELRGAIFSLLAGNHIAGTVSEGGKVLVPVLTSRKKFNKSYNELLNWLYQDARREVAPHDSKSARPNIKVHGKFVCSDGSAFSGAQLKKAMDHPELAAPAGAPTWWTPAWWRAWARARRCPATACIVPALAPSSDDDAPCSKRRCSPVQHELPASLATTYDVLSCMPGDDLPVPTWYAYEHSRALAVTDLVRNLGQHGGVLVTENATHPAIHTIVYANLDMPVPDAATAAQHMRQILLLQQWLDRKCAPTPAPEDREE
jgi:hypothetical protein